jgi:uncharacterized iron-regulated membrane protein
VVQESGDVSRDPPTAWRRWVEWPQTLPLRRALFQVHLWIAIALGLYIVMISVTGSAVVFRREVSAWFIPRSVPSTAGVRLTADGLKEAVQRAYPNHEITDIHEFQRRLERPVYVGLRRDGEESERLFDPYTGTDMGSSYPPIVRAVEWLVVLHDDLLGGRTGRVINGIAGLLCMLLFVTGAVIWWPGKRRWKQSLLVSRPTKTRKFAWDTHSALGFWSLALLLIWAVTAVYFAFPEPFDWAMDLFDDDLTDAHRPGEFILLFLIKLHFGRFGGLGVRVLWTVLGLLPAVLFVTGFIMWWTRVVRRRWRRTRDLGAGRLPQGAAAAPTDG